MGPIGRDYFIKRMAERSTNIYSEGVTKAKRSLLAFSQKRTKSMSSIGVVLMLLRWRRFLSHHPLGGREFVRGQLSASPCKEIVRFYFTENFLDHYSMGGLK